MKMLDFLAERLATDGVCVSVRGNAIRALPHVCCEPRDIDRLSAASRKNV